MATINSAPSFSVGDGKVTTDLQWHDYGYSIIVQTDGQILVAGYSYGDHYDFALARYHPDGTLDATFSGNGKINTDFGSYDYSYGVAIQTDGKILMAGYTWNGSNDDFALARYNPDGSLDTTFSGDGKLTTDFGGYDWGRSLAVQADGKILVVGTAQILDAWNVGNNDFALARYNPDGSLDTTFSGDGKVTTGFVDGWSDNEDSGRSIAVQADGKILVAGSSDSGSNDFALVRYNPDGSLDTTFSSDGKLTTDFGNDDSGYSVVVQADGKILVAGQSGNNFALARYNPDGTLDTSFDGDGRLTTANGSGQSVAVQADGKILVAGSSYNGSNIDFALVRYNPNGSLDTTFSGDGKVTTAIGSGDDSGHSITVQADGKILVAGESGNGSNSDFALVRYNPDGSLDTSFDAVNTQGGTVYYYAESAVILDSDVAIRDTELDALNGGLGNYNGATFTLARHGGASAQDIFSATGSLSPLMQGGSFSIGGTVIGTVTQNSGGTLMLLFNSNATTALVSEAMRQIAYSNTSGIPPISVQVDWTFSDGNTGVQGTGGALTATGATTVNIVTELVGTADNDTLIGDQNGAGRCDLISGLDGNDILKGLAGNDTLLGGNGHDWLNGGTGVDFLIGGAGNDTYMVDNASDSVMEYFNEGTDTVQSSVTYILSSDVENLTLTGTAAINGTGNYLNNILTGNSGNNVLTDDLFGFGYGVSNDLLNGGGGADTLAGGLGNDTYVVDNVGDVVMEQISQGTDTVRSSASYTLKANVENLTLTGMAAIDGTGNGLANTLTGNGAANRLDGGFGADLLKGGAGNDTYVVDNTGDVITETNTSPTEIDLVQSSVSFKLGANLENLQLLGTGTTGYGNALNNVLTGDMGNNFLAGQGGNDTLNGGTGADILSGDDGNDTYVVDNAGDVVTETNTSPTEIDTVQSGISYTLGANVENLTLIGTAALNGTGNTLANVLTGNVGNNVLDGGLGNDRLNGGAGADTLKGGSGNDTYVVDNASDSIVENAGEGTDLILSTVSRSLTGGHVENLALTGTAAINGFGNALNNALTGNAGNNVLNGWVGADILRGGLGADTFVFSTLTGGADTVRDFLSGTDKLRFLDGTTGLKIGDGDHVIDNATVANASGAFASTAELVILTPNASALDAASAAAAIGSASAAYVAGDTRLFAVDNGVNSALYLFKSAGADALVDATELTLVGTLQGAAQTALADYALA
jgi:uncharacterized delta-60 repeat protein